MAHFLSSQSFFHWALEKSFIFFVLFCFLRSSIMVYHLSIHTSPRTNKFLRCMLTEIGRILPKRTTRTDERKSRSSTSVKKEQEPFVAILATHPPPPLLADCLHPLFFVPSFFFLRKLMHRNSLAAIGKFVIRS